MSLFSTFQGKIWGIMALGVAVLLAHMGYYYPYTPDDTFISLRYAQRLVQGKGLTWNDGEYVEGYSDMLWVLLTAGLHFLGMDLLVAAQFMSALCALLTPWAFYYYAVRYALPLQALLPCILVFALSAPVAIWGVGGLETTLVMLCFAWVLVLSRQLLEHDDRHLALKIGVLLGIICWLRPEGPFYTAAIALGLLAMTKRIRIPAIISITAFLFFAAELIFRLSYYGTWIPNAVLAKVSFSALHVVSGLVYVMKAWLSFLPVLLMISYASQKFPAQGTARRYGFFLLGIGIFLSIAIMMAGGDWLLGYRAFVPLVPLLVLLLMESCRLLCPVALVTLMLLVHAAIQFIDKDNLNANMGKEWVQETMRPIGEELRRRFGDKQPLIAVFTAGAIPYYSELPTLDVYGLNDAYLTAHRHELKHFGQGLVGHDLFDEEYVESRKPDILVFEIPGITSQCEVREEECEKLYVHYTPVMLEMPGYDVKIWVRKGSQKVPATTVTYEP